MLHTEDELVDHIAPSTTPIMALDKAERLAWLGEELGEVQQAIGKVLRHGYNSSSPLIQNAPLNKLTLEQEIGDVLAVMEIMQRQGDLDKDVIYNRRLAKLNQFSKGKCYMHYQKI